jgi:hypothetical protein
VRDTLRGIAREPQVVLNRKQTPRRERDLYGS